MFFHWITFLRSSSPKHLKVVVSFNCCCLFMSYYMIWWLKSRHMSSSFFLFFFLKIIGWKIQGSTGKMGGSSYFDTRKCSTTWTKGPSFTWNWRFMECFEGSHSWGPVLVPFYFHFLDRYAEAVRHS